MKKSKIVTAAYLALTFILIFLGLGFMRKMLKITREKTLSQKGNIPLAATDNGEDADLTESNKMPLTEYYRGETMSPSGGSLSLEESAATDSSICQVSDMPIYDLRNVVEIINNTSARKLHEPYGSQLKMKDALDIGESWIDRMYSDGPEYFGIETSDKYEMVRAELYGNDVEVEYYPLSRDFFSFWYIEYEIQDILGLRLYINAVTGKVMKARINSYTEVDFTEYSKEVLEGYLNAFAGIYGLKDEDFSGKVVSSEGNRAPFECLSIAGGELYLILETGALSEKSSYMNIYLSTTPKEEKLYDVVTYDG